MKNISKKIGSTILLTVFLTLSSCTTEEVCMTEAYRVPHTASVKESVLTHIIPGTLTENVYLEGDVVVEGNLHTNGYDIEINGSLTIEGNYHGDESSLIIVSESIEIMGNVHLNESIIRSDSVSIDGNVQGGGYIYWCSYINVEGDVHDHQLDPVLNQDCGTLSDNTPEYEIVTVPCDYIGNCVEGYLYIEKN